MVIAAVDLYLRLILSVGFCQTGPPQYRSSTIFEDAIPEMVRDFFWDDEFRPKFDPMLIHSETLEKSHTTGTMVVQWVRKVTNFLLKHCRGPTPLLAYNRLLLAICSFRSSAVTESTLLAAGYGSVKEHFTV